jgi:hydrogenase nickel incorporation protein HypB
MKNLKKVISSEEETIEVEPGMDILKVNEKLAHKNRELLRKHNVKAIDVMGSIGAGKTSLIEKLVQTLKEKYHIAVFKGDLTTTIDAERIGRHGVEVVAINTGRECHLDANLIAKAVQRINLESIDLLFIENVGNLICPAEFPLGSEKRIVVVSVTEGPYMVVKHPFSFMDADIVVINKKDLAEVMKVDTAKLDMDVKEIKPNMKVVVTDALTGEGVGELVEALEL